LWISVYDTIDEIVAFYELGSVHPTGYNDFTAIKNCDGYSPTHFLSITLTIASPFAITDTVIIFDIIEVFNIDPWINTGLKR
tara:strand:+ start:264 stop:509 length:246 start_codon:yes stop_codon:yes gene_type:complete